MKNTRFAAIVLIPAVALLTLFVIVPIVGSFVISLFEYNPLRSHSEFLGLGNFMRLLEDQVYIKSLTNTIVFVFITVSINISLTLILGAFISSVGRKWIKNAFLVSIFLPCVAPVANSAVVWSRSLFPTKGGLLNELVMAIGGSPLNWGGSPAMIMPSIILFTVWVDIGYNTVLFTAGMDGIPRDFYEAANIDGAGTLKKFFFVTLPLLGRTFSFVTAMTLISHFQMFAQFEILAKNGGPGKAGQVLTTYIYYTGFTAKDMGYASAISVTLFLLVIAITIVQQRLNRVDWGY